MSCQNIYRGTNQSATGIIRNSDGSPYNLTGKAVEVFVKRKNSNVILIYKDGILSATPSDGGYTIVLTTSDSVNLPPGTYDLGILVRYSGMLVYSGREDIEVKTPGEA